MEKKRKRASFSPEMPSSIKTTAKPRKEETDKPVVKQVVEVLVEEPKHPQSKTTQINVIIPPPEPEKAELETAEPRTVEQETAPDENDLEELSVEAEVTEVELVEEADKKESAEDKPKQESAPKPRITFGQTKNSEEEEKQKETVEELFGKNSQTVMPEITVHKGSNTRGIVLWAVTMIAIAVGVGGGLILFTGKNNKIQQPIPSIVAKVTPTVQVTPEPTIAPTPAISRSELKVQVLNGGGVVGAGSKMKTLLTEKGYEVVNVGNVEGYGFDETEIVVKATQSAALQLLKTDLGDDYTIGKLETTLPTSSQYDVVVTVGKN